MGIGRTCNEAFLVALLALSSVLGGKLLVYVRASNDVSDFGQSLTKSGSDQQQEQLGDELVRLQTQQGLTLASFYRSINIVSLKRHETIRGKEFLVPALRGTFSRDGSKIAADFSDQGGYLGILSWDGTLIRRYPNIRGVEDVCWSFDNSNLLVTLEEPSLQHQPPESKLEMVGLNSIDTRGIKIDVRARATSQCWSPDNKYVVYEVNGEIRTYDIARRVWKILAKGIQPTWSQDGTIAFLDEGTYWSIEASGEDRKRLFYRRNAASGLYWAPDSRIVAFTTRVGLRDLFDGIVPPLDAETYRLWILRLSDGAQESVSGNWGTGGFQWVENKALIAALRSHADLQSVSPQNGSSSREP